MDKSKRDDRSKDQPSDSTDKKSDNVNLTEEDGGSGSLAPMLWIGAFFVLMVVLYLIGQGN